MTAMRRLFRWTFGAALVFAAAVAVHAYVNPPPNRIYNEEEQCVRKTLAAERVAQDAVLTRLKAPSTAKFSEVLTYLSHIGRGNCVYVSRGNIDSQNSFGAMLRGRYEAFVSEESGSWRATDVTVK